MSILESILKFVLLVITAVTGFCLVILAILMMSMMWLCGYTLVINKQKYRYFWKIQ